ncbi:MAG: hypothetical protein Q8K99_06770 [Actinomycetota bacterium]|nr:hypothetical protein [Actinomycetota bacterium]
MAGNATWRRRDTHGKLSEAKERELPDSAFAFPQQRKGPLTGAAHVRDAITNFAQFDDVSDEDRDLAFENIRKAAEHYHVDMPETDWRQLGTRPPKRSYSRGGR